MKISRRGTRRSGGRGLLKAIMQTGPAGPAKYGLTEYEWNWLCGYLNPAHGSYLENMPPAPNVSGLQIKSYLATTNIIMPPGSIPATMSFCTIPAVEAQLIGYNNGTATYVAYSDPGIDNITQFMKQHGVAGYRVAAQSIKIRDLTQDMYRKGMITMATVPNPFDNQVMHDTANNTYCYIRTYESVPNNSAAITGSIKNFTKTSVNEQPCVYKPNYCMEVDQPWIMRDKPENKGHTVQCYDRTNINQVYTNMNALGVKRNGSASIYLPNIVTAYDPGVSETNYSTCTQKVHDTGFSMPCNWSSTQAVLEGFDTTNSTISIEVQTKFDFCFNSPSDFAPDARIWRQMPSWKALSMASLAMSLMPGSYPESANFLDSIIKKAKELWDEYGSPFYQSIRPVISAASTALPPQYQTVVGGVTSLLDKVSTAEKKINQAEKTLAKTEQKLSQTIESAGNRGKH